MNVFLDVGSHEGQTLEEVTKPAYGFRAIHAFEPMPGQFAELADRWNGTDPVHLHKFGLSDVTHRVRLYGDNANMGASIYPEKHDIDPAVATEVAMVRATDWFLRHLGRGAIVTMKLNCEGSEVPILLDLCSSGEIHRITNLLIDFDIRKVPGMEAEEQHVLARLAEVGFHDFVLAEDVMRGATHQDRIGAWLGRSGR